jgi:hypothetical protein
MVTLLRASPASVPGENSSKFVMLRDDGNIFVDTFAKANKLYGRVSFLLLYDV